MKPMLRAAIVALFVCAAPLQAAAEDAPWRPVSEETGQIRDIDGLEQLARDFPDSGTVRLRVLQPHLAAGEFEKVLDTLEWLYDRGYVFGEVSQQQIPKLLEGVDPGRIAERLRAEAEVIEASEVIANVPAEAGLVESVVRHPATNMLVVSSVTGNSLHVFLPNNVWANVPMPQVSDLTGIVWDAHTGVNWIASSNVDGSEDNEAFMEGLLGVADAVQPTAFAHVPEGAKISDLAATVDGTIFASDPINGGIYAKLPGLEVSLEEFIPPGTFRSPQGLAVSEDNSRLYVSDYRYGIAIIDLETRKVSRLASDIPVILDGVDGMWRYGNELIAVQNGTSPMRISAFELSEDGMRVVGYRVLEQANPEWTEPLSGSIDGDRLLYIGNGQWDKFVDGELGQGMEVVATQIRALPLSKPAE